MSNEYKQRSRGNGGGGKRTPGLHFKGNDWQENHVHT